MPRMNCSACLTPIEYPIEYEGQSSPCPTCGEPVQLVSSSPTPLPGVVVAATPNPEQDFVPPSMLGKKSSFKGESKSSKPKAKSTICDSCGSADSGEKITPGSIGIEIILWLLFLLPGLCYSVWRLSAKKIVCKQCGSSELIPINTPKGYQMLKKMG